MNLNLNGLTELPNNYFERRFELRSILIPSTITKLEQNCFEHCVNLTKIEFENNSVLKNLPYKCFYECCSLKNITIPSTITSIDDYCFGYCTDLKEIDLGKSVEIVGECSFVNCYNLELIEIPKSVKNIGEYCFMNCFELSRIQFNNHHLKKHIFKKYNSNEFENLFLNCINLRFDL